eukprot:scaffold18932_cov112-Skeletonema_dohrnii-CCMP3373.AAC.2
MATDPPPESDLRRRNKSRWGQSKLPITQTQQPRPSTPKKSSLQQLILSNIISFSLGVICCTTYWIWIGSTTQESVGHKFTSTSGARGTDHSLVNGVVAKHVMFDWEAAIESGSITSLDGTTGVGVPGKIRE